MVSSEPLDILYPLRLIGLPFSWNHGQCCCAGTRIFVQSGVYDNFLAKFTETVKAIKVGDPFAKGTNQGPQVSQLRFDVRLSPSLFYSENNRGSSRQSIMSYIESGKKEGAKVHLGGRRVGNEGYFIEVRPPFCLPCHVGTHPPV